MSPTKRPSAVAGLRKGLGTAALPVTSQDASSDVAPVMQDASRIKPVRVTLNIRPDLYRQLTRWLDSAAEEIGAPRVSQQDALRAMIRATVLDKGIAAVVTDLVRRDNEG